MKLDQLKLEILIKAMYDTSLRTSLKTVKINRESFPIVDMEQLFHNNGFEDIQVSHRQHKYPLERIK